jgi:hypothetical protein
LVLSTIFSMIDILEALLLSLKRRDKKERELVEDLKLKYLLISSSIDS